MNQPVVVPEVAPATSKAGLISIIVFVVIVVGGEFYVKWDPYFHKVFVAAAKHSIGTSIISGKSEVAPAPSLGAAWGYALQYLASIWQALILGIVVGSAVQVLLPKRWILRVFQPATVRSTAMAGIAAIPGMMCTCCAAPIAVGLRKDNASVGAALAFWLGNPVLNPATILFMGFVLGWNYAVLRVVLGLLLVFVVSHFANRFTDTKAAISDRAEDRLQQMTQAESGGVLLRFLRQLWKMSVTMLPVYLILVLLVGATRAWLFPVGAIGHANSVLAMIGLSVTGMLFVIPTAGEIPIVQTLLHFHLGVGPAAALMLTLPAISVPSLSIVWNEFPKRALAFVSGAVVVMGIVGGFIAMALF